MTTAEQTPLVTNEDGAVLGINWRELVESGQIR